MALWHAVLLQGLPVVGSETAAEPGSGIFARVREEVDLRKVFPFSRDARPFESGYTLDYCVHPDHTDSQKSLLVYPDGCNCRGCGWSADTTAVYRMFHPELTMLQAAQHLLDGDYAIDRNARPVVERRVLEQDLALRYHLALAQSPTALEKLEAFGFERGAIRHFRLGLSRPLVRLDQSRDTFDESTPDLEWREVDGERVAYQWQDRFAVPVFSGRGELKQIIHRKLDGDQLGPKTTLEARAGTEWLYNEAALKDAKFAAFASGWGDVIVLHQWGVPAVCSIAGDGTFRQEWQAPLSLIPRLYSFTDADKAGQKLRERLSRDLPWIRHVTLPYEVGSKADPRQFRLDGHSRSELYQLMRRADAETAWKALSRRS